MLVRSSRTGWKTFVEDGVKYRIRAEYGMQHFAGRAPYLSLTGEIQRQAGNHHWYEDSGGCIHDEIVKHFPDLAPLVRWHLTSTDGPLHYLANSKYWFGEGKYVERNLDHFRSTCLYGVLPEDAQFDLESADWSTTEAWFKERLPKLLDAFRGVLAQWGWLE